MRFWARFHLVDRMLVSLVLLPSHFFFPNIVGPLSSLHCLFGNEKTVSIPLLVLLQSLSFSASPAPRDSSLQDLNSPCFAHPSLIHQFEGAHPPFPPLSISCMDCLCHPPMLSFLPSCSPPSFVAALFFLSPLEKETFCIRVAPKASSSVPIHFPINDASRRTIAFDTVVQ